MIPNLQGLAVKFAVAVMVAALAFGAGFYTKGRFVSASLAEDAKVAHQQTAKDITHSMKISAELSADIDKSDTSAVITKNKIDSRLKQKTIYITKECTNETGEAKNAEVTLGTADDVRLDVATVGMLNELRAGRLDSSPASSDGASAAPSETTLGTLVGNDAEVVRLYHGLAKRHDALIYFVEDIVKKQAK